MRKWLVLVSLAAHALVVAAYVVAGMWQIEKVSFDRPPVQLAAMTPMAMEDPGAGLEPGQKPKDPERPRPDTRIAEDITQPEPAAAAKAAAATPASTPDPGAPIGAGGKGPPGKTPSTGDTVCLDPAGCRREECVGEACKPPPFVPPLEIAKARLTGETRIVPDEVTKTAMQRDGHPSVLGMVRFCMDARGRITSAAIQKSTGYPDYDARLVAGVRGWTYRPHTIGATPIPVCSTVSFRFAMR